MNYHIFVWNGPKVNAPKEYVTPVVVGTSADARVGQAVFAIGNPFGFDHTLTTGVISGLNRTIQSQAGSLISGGIQARSYLRRSPYDRVGAVNADPQGLSLPAHLSAQGLSVSIPTHTPRRLSTPLLTPLNSTSDAFQLRPSSARRGVRRVHSIAARARRERVTAPLGADISG